MEWIASENRLPSSSIKVVVARWDTAAQKYVLDVDRYIVESEANAGRWAGDGRFGDAEVKFWLSLPDLPK